MTEFDCNTLKYTLTVFTCSGYNISKYIFFFRNLNAKTEIR